MKSTEPTIAVAGNQWITKYLLDEMLRHKYKPSLLINLSPEKSKNISGYYDLADHAGENQIELYRPDTYTLLSETDKKYFGSKNIDVLIVFGWQRLIPGWLIEMCPKGVFGVHGGPEKPPRCRGRAVFNWAILLGYSSFYMYLFKITPGADEGDIVELTEFEISSHDDIASVYHKNCVVSSRMLLKNLPGILEGKVNLIGQGNGSATYLPKRSPENGGIDWNWPAQKIIDLIRALNTPYPGAFTYLEQAKVFIYRAHIFDTKITYPEHVLGTILEVFPNGDIVVMTSDFPIYIRNFETERTGDIKKGLRFQLKSGEPVSTPVI